MKSYIIKNGELIRYKGYASQPKIPNGITEIGPWAFEILPFLTSIKIPSGVTEIGYRAFQDCTSLKSITIPNSVTFVNALAFNNIKKVKPQYNANGTLRAFKAFNSDWTCRRFQFEIGKSYHQDGKIICCVNGFHACPNPLSVFDYYYGDLRYLRFAEVELSGETHWNDNKVAASDIRIVRELSITELAEIFNSMEKG